MEVLPGWYKELLNDKSGLVHLLILCYTFCGVIRHLVLNPPKAAKHCKIITLAFSTVHLDS